MGKRCGNHHDMEAFRGTGGGSSSQIEFFLYWEEKVDISACIANWRRFQFPVEENIDLWKRNIVQGKDSTHDRMTYLARGSVRG